MYGTLDHQKGETIVNELNENRNETVMLHNLMINQTTLFKASLKINEQNMERIQNGLNQAMFFLKETREGFKVTSDIQILRQKAKH